MIKTGWLRADFELHTVEETHGPSARRSLRSAQLNGFQKMFPLDVAIGSSCLETFNPERHFRRRPQLSPKSEQQWRAQNKCDESNIVESERALQLDMLCISLQKNASIAKPTLLFPSPAIHACTNIPRSNHRDTELPSTSLAYLLLSLVPFSPRSYLRFRTNVLTSVFHVCLRILSSISGLFFPFSQLARVLLTLQFCLETSAASSAHQPEVNMQYRQERPGTARRDNAVETCGDDTLHPTRNHADERSSSKKD